MLLKSKWLYLARLCNGPVAWVFGGSLNSAVTDAGKSLGLQAVSCNAKGDY